VDAALLFLPRPALPPYKEHKWDHLKEAKRQAEVEASGRADMADLYE
jgi:hypothetical protein